MYVVKRLTDFWKSVKAVTSSGFSELGCLNLYVSKDGFLLPRVTCLSSNIA